MLADVFVLIQVMLVLDISDDFLDDVARSGPGGARASKQGRQNYRNCDTGNRS